MEFILGQLINDSIISEKFPVEATDAVLIPIPLHNVKQWNRVYNQAQVIAVELLFNGISHFIRYCCNGKSILGYRQLSILMNDRKNMYRAFKAVNNTSETVLLKDDVLATGSTADVCAYTLR